MVCIFNDGHVFMLCVNRSESDGQSCAPFRLPRPRRDLTGRIYHLCRLQCQETCRCLEHWRKLFTKKKRVINTNRIRRYSYTSEPPKINNRTSKIYSPTPRSILFSSLSRLQITSNEMYKYGILYTTKQFYGDRSADNLIDEVFSSLP